MARHKREVQGCAMDMTPMIDVVFQLIIFFIVTMNMIKKVNEDIVLADGKHGETIKEMPPSTFEIEVDQHGKISVKGGYITLENLNNQLKMRYERYGVNYPLLIRADERAKHGDVKKVLDLCTYYGLWQINMVAVEKRAPKPKK